MGRDRINRDMGGGERVKESGRAAAEGVCVEEAMDQKKK